MKDDLFDYSDQKIGKPTGIDIREQKITLPLIYTLNNCSKKGRAWLMNSIKRHNKEKKRVGEVISFVKEKGGIAYTNQQMHHHKTKSPTILDGFQDSAYENSLIKMIDYVVERKI